MSDAPAPRDPSHDYQDLLPETVPEPTCEPLGARVIVQAVALGTTDGGWRPLSGLLSTKEMPHCDLWLVIARGKGELLHGLWTTPPVEPGDLVILQKGADPVPNAFLPRLQGIIHGHEIAERRAGIVPAPWWELECEWEEAKQRAEESNGRPLTRSELKAAKEAWRSASLRAWGCTQPRPSRARPSRSRGVHRAQAEGIINPGRTQP